MKILVLDDNPYRHDVFDRIYEGNEIVHSTRALDCIQHIKNTRFDIIHLDHDLGDFDEVNGAPDFWIDGWGIRRELNGQNVAMALCDAPVEFRPGSVIIHSVNPEGARRMLSIIQKTGIPVTWEPF